MDTSVTSGHYCDTNKMDFEQIDSKLESAIGLNFRRRRQRLGLSQKVCADIMNVTRTHYMRYESGSAAPRLYQTLLLSLVTGIPPLWFYENTPYQSHIKYLLPPKWQPLVSLLSLSSTDNLNYCHRMFKDRSLALPCFEPVWQGTDLPLPRKETFYKNLAGDLKRVRSQACLTQAQAAASLGVSDSTFQSWESSASSNSISFSLLIRFSLVLNIYPIPISASANLYSYRVRQLNMLSELVNTIKLLAKKQQSDYISLAYELLDELKLIKTTHEKSLSSPYNQDIGKP